MSPTAVLRENRSFHQSTGAAATGAAAGPDGDATFLAAAVASCVLLMLALLFAASLLRRVCWATGLSVRQLAALRSKTSTVEAALDLLSTAVATVAVPVLRRVCHIPHTVCFVMDGNRRWATQRGLPTRDGHAEGYKTLQQLLLVCSALGVREVTVYAFSIPNFKRGAEEKTYLMRLAAEKFDEMLTRGDVVEEHDVRVRVVGARARLPEAVQEAAARVEARTKHRRGCTLNIAFAYASRTELLAHAAEGACSGQLWVPTCTAPSPPLFVRTSGEQRFSDFLTWQSGYAHLVFQKVLWPDYRVWHLVYALVDYTWRYKSTAAARDASSTLCDTAQDSSPPQ